MEKTRQDAWMKEEDLLLAEVVINYIQNGKTQLAAFKEVGKRLMRTPAACGFRWNAQIRQQHSEAITLAKAARKQVSNLEEDFKKPITENQTIEKAISFLETIRDNVNHTVGQSTRDLENYIIKLKQDNEQLKQKLTRYEMGWQEMEKLWKWIEKEERHF